MTTNCGSAQTETGNRSVGRPIMLVTWLLVLAVLYFGGGAIWDIFYPSVTLHYRITVAVDTPEGVKTGSAVREMHARYGPALLGETTGGHACLTKGEAVVVDLGERGVVFAPRRAERRAA